MISLIKTMYLSHWYLLEYLFIQMINMFRVTFLLFIIENIFLFNFFTFCLMTIFNQHMY